MWAYSSQQHYKNDSDQIVAKAVATNTTKVQKEESDKYAEAAKQPLKVYAGPEAYGSVHVSYPKTWSGYVNTYGGSTPLDAYFYPDVVPSVNDPDSSFALRVQVVTQSYDQVVNQYTSSLSQKKVTVTPYALPKVQNIVGVRIDGQLSSSKQGSLVLIPVRDKTLKIWTEASDFKPDFDSIILPNITFSP